MCETTLAVGCWAAEHNFGKLFGEPNLMIRNLKQEAGEVTTADGSPLDFGVFSCVSADAPNVEECSPCFLTVNQLVAVWLQVGTR